MPFRPIAPSKEVDTSSLAGLGKSVLDIAQWAYVQFNAVASSFQSTEPVKVWTSPPPKPRVGTTAYADGTNWNPGSGKGPYAFDGTTWQPASGASIIPTGSLMFFVNAAAPMGWTRVTTVQDDSLIRVMATAGIGGGGGSTGFSVYNAVSATGGYTLAVADIPSHAHPGSTLSTTYRYYTPDINNGVQAPTGGAVVGAQSGGTVTVASQGGGGSHSHPLTRNIKYIDTMLASKN